MAPEVAEGTEVLLGLASQMLENQGPTPGGTS